jgi:hypothetical protein
MLETLGEQIFLVFIKLEFKHIIFPFHLVVHLKMDVEWNNILLEYTAFQN